MPLEKLVLENGLRIYIDKYQSDTISIAILVHIGSIYEEPRYRGVSHFVEHMLFKSNKKYSSKDILRVIELSGGYINAFVDRKATTIVAEILSEAYDKLIDVLYNIYVNDEFSEKEFEAERNIILSEISEHKNTPSSWISNLLLLSLYGDSDLGAPIAGTHETVNNITREYAEEFKRRYYVPSNTEIILCGPVNRDKLEALIDIFSKLEDNKTILKKPSRSYKGLIIDEREDIDKAYYGMIFEVDTKGITPSNMMILDHTLSSGTTSILFQEVREARGLSYDYYSEWDWLMDTAYFSISINGVEPDKVSYADNILSSIRGLVVKYLRDKDYEEGRKRFYKYATRVKHISGFDRAWLTASLISNKLYVTIEDLLDKTISSNWLEMVEDIRITKQAKAVIEPRKDKQSS